MQATEAPPEPTTTEPAPPIRSDKQLFRFSTWIHVGPDAETCDEGEQGTCSNPLHFHAWARLPNQFQHRHIREKALAAKARRARQLRDPESDAHAVMEDELDEIARLGDAGRKQLIDDLIGRDWWRDFLEAAKDVKEIENDRDEQVYATIDEDQQRFKELDAKPEDERPKDEYDELERHLAAYNDAVDKRRAELEKPRRDVAGGARPQLADRHGPRREDHRRVDRRVHARLLGVLVAGRHARQAPRRAALPVA